LTEGWPGGYSPIYKVLRTMEEAGKIRRGYFIEGLAGSQFGGSGAIERLRGCRSCEGREETVEPADFVALAALDPANPYGALLPWPESPASPAPRRVAGAWVVLWHGSPALYAAQNGRQVIRFAEPPLPEAVWDGAFELLRRMPMAGRKGFLIIEKLDGVPVRDAAGYERLRSLGFERDSRGLVAAPTA
jgi:ATP-dependent Lhr-like helicase